MVSDQCSKEISTVNKQVELSTSEKNDTAHHICRFFDQKGDKNWAREHFFCLTWRTTYKISNIESY